MTSPKQAGRSSVTSWLPSLRVPGLLSKFWLHGEGDIRGGVQLWTDRDPYLTFLDSALGRALGIHPNIADLTLREYAVDQAPTEVTRGLVGAVA